MIWKETNAKNNNERQYSYRNLFSGLHLHVPNIKKTDTDTEGEMGRERKKWETSFAIWRECYTITANRYSWGRQPITYSPVRRVADTLFHTHSHIHSFRKCFWAFYKFCLLPIDSQANWRSSGIDLEMIPFFIHCRFIHYNGRFSAVYSLGCVKLDLIRRKIVYLDFALRKKWRLLRKRLHGIEQLYEIKKNYHCRVT